MFRALVVSALLFGPAIVANAAQPVVFYHTPPAGKFWATSSQGYVDIDGTEKTVTVPTGTALLTWHLFANTGAVRIRPAIGSMAPAEGMLFPSGMSSQISGSWATPVQAGTLDVRLQVAGVEGFGYEPTIGTCWNLVVFPEAEPTAPAVGVTGLGLFVGILLSSGAWVIVHRWRPGVT